MAFSPLLIFTRHINHLFTKALITLLCKVQLLPRVLTTHQLELQGVLDITQVTARHINTQHQDQAQPAHNMGLPQAGNKAQDTVSQTQQIQATTRLQLVIDQQTAQHILLMLLLTITTIVPLIHQLSNTERQCLLDTRWLLSLDTLLMQVGINLDSLDQHLVTCTCLNHQHTTQLLLLTLILLVLSTAQLVKNQKKNKKRKRNRNDFNTNTN